MFEFSIAKGYLWPRKRQLSISLIGILSIFVISLVIWLVLLFLSITEGIEKNWLTKLTSLNAPIRITPTEEYYNSYYYQIDSIASNSDFSYKTIHEKRFTNDLNPYDPTCDEEIPFYWPVQEIRKDGEPMDLVKNAFTAIEAVGREHKGLFADDYNMCGALMRLRLVRPEVFSGRSTDQQSFLTQGTYLSSFSQNSKQLASLIQTPSPADLNHLIYQFDRTVDADEVEDRPMLTLKYGHMVKEKEMRAIFSNIEIEELEAKSGLFQLDQKMLPKGASFVAFARVMNGKPLFLVVPTDRYSDVREKLVPGTLRSIGDQWTFFAEDFSFIIEKDIPLLIENDLSLTPIKTTPYSLKESTLTNFAIPVSAMLQGRLIQGDVPWSGLAISKAKIRTHFEEAPEFTPPWVHFVGESAILPKNGVLLPKNYRESNVLIGDRGFFSYGASTPTSIQEQRVPMLVVGFYDPGVMGVGARFILCHDEVVQSINKQSEHVSLDPMMGSGIQVWVDDIKDSRKVAYKLSEEFKKSGLSPYWKITTFYDYEFAKDLMTQFQSDRYLFMLVGALILFVACCNIISLLLVLVNDKKQEIGILLSLGAKKRHIAFIFALCGMFLGVIACTIGLSIAYFTLANIDSLVRLLNILEGQEAFNAVFYGSSLPSELSRKACEFVIIATPILSMLSGLIPAMKACQLKPSAILRSE